MSHAVRIEAPAARDIELAFEWYEARRSGLGVEFLAAVAVARDVLAREPERFGLARGEFRWVKLRKFPYALHFRIKNGEVRVAACLHFRQSPNRWPTG